MQTNNNQQIEAAYQDTLKWIHSTMRFGSRLGLERISRLLEILGNPQQYTKFVHVTGTNGKGSVTAIIASILKEAGYRAGMFISPYLEDYRERIMLNGKKIPKQDIVSITKQVRKAIGQIVDEGFEHPTEFEINTAIGLIYFAQENCDYAVLEVGMGGRFDATNIVNPVVSVITTVDFDHMDRLGNTLSKIAFEKAGIIKPGVPVVTGATETEALSVIKERAEHYGCELTIVGNVPFADVTWTQESDSKTEHSPSGQDSKNVLGRQVINISGPDFAYKKLNLPLLGDHQQSNAALAVAALKAAKVKPLAVTSPKTSNWKPAQTAHNGGARPSQASLENTQNDPACHASPSVSSGLGASRRIYLDEQAIRTGIAKTVWPGRLEIMHEAPMIILDAAHNPQGAEVLAEFISKLSRKVICVFGILGDKCYKEQTAYITPLCHEVIVTKPHTPRALDPEILAQEARLYTPNVLIEKDVGKAVELAISRAASDEVVLCCGSLYLVGPARTFIRNKFGISPYGGE